MLKNKVLLFDLDDTLVVTYKIRRYALVEAGKRFYNVDISLDQIEAAYGKPWYELLRMVFGDVAPPEEISQNFLTLLDDFPKKYQPGFHELIQKMDRNNIISGIITASGAELIDQDMKSMNFPRSSFNWIQSADDSLYHKPDGRVFDPALKYLDETYGKRREDIVYIGDSFSDKLAAESAGIQFIGVTTGQTSKETLEEGGTKVIPSLEEIVAVL